MQNIFKEMVAFKNNLDLQLEDLSLESTGTLIELYFDASDIYEAVLGLEAFYTMRGSFDLSKFKDKRALVHSLAASGWIGEYQLLPPHQTEFLTQLNLHFGVGRERDPKGRARKFLEDIGITNTEEFKNIYFEDLSKEQLYDFIRRQAGLAETLFKASQCIVPWHKRFVRLQSQKILIIAASKLHYDRIVQAEHFRLLKHSFDERRPNTPVNNFSDAAAITILIDMVNNYKVGTSKRLPRFFLPSSLFLEIINDAGIESLLSYQSPAGIISSVLRNSDYYIFKASFRQRKRFISVEDELVDKASEEYLRILNTKVASIIESQEALTEEAVEKIDFYGKPLSEVIKDLQMFSFLENVWLKFEAQEEITQALSVVAEAAREISQSKTFKKSVKEAIEALKDEFDESVNEFKWISSIWTRFERAAEELRFRTDIDTFSLPNFFRELGLLRYGFPKSSHQSIRNVLQELLRGEMAEKDARVAVITACYRGRENPSKNIDNLIMGVAILLVTRMDAELLWLLNKTKPLPHFSLGIVLAEMLFKLNPESERGAKLLKQLEREYEASPFHSRKRGDLAVGVAYLLVRLWRTRGGHPIWREHLDVTLQNQNELRQLYLDKAVMYAQQAYKLLGDDLMKKVYALNQYLFYLVEGSSDSRIPEMNEAAMDLSVFKVNRELWQYRFDDTLARYFYRLSIIAKDEERWKELIAQAKRHSEEARRKSHGDEEVEYFSTVLAVAIATGYQGRSKG